MRFVGTAYRGHDPKWAFAPLSGEGAAIYGARFNPKGVPALYLATTPEGAFLEATQGLAFRFKPLTLVSYEVDCTDIVDLSHEDARREAGVDLATLDCAWAEEVFGGRRPTSWNVYDLLRGSAAGILVPSFAYGATPEMTNLVLWDWGESGPHRISVFDPDNRLPRDQASWQ